MLEIYHFKGGTMTIDNLLISPYLECRIAWDGGYGDYTTYDIAMNTIKAIKDEHRDSEFYWLEDRDGNRIEIERQDVDNGL